MSVSDGAWARVSQSRALSSLLGTTQGISTINNKLAPWQTIRDSMGELWAMNIQDLTHVLLTRDDGSVLGKWRLGRAPRFQPHLSARGYLWTGTLKHKNSIKKVPSTKMHSQQQKNSGALGDLSFTLMMQLMPVFFLGPGWACLEGKRHFFSS